MERTVVVDVSPEKAWEVLSSYGDVGSFIHGVKSSKSLNGSMNKAHMNCDRQCMIQNGKQEMTIKEKIIDISEGNYYTYDVYSFEGFPFKVDKFNITFGVDVNENGKTVVYQKVNYRLKSGLLTAMMKGQLKKGAGDTLLGYKHYMETGEKNVEAKILRKKYRKV